MGVSTRTAVRTLEAGVRTVLEHLRQARLTCGERLGSARAFGSDGQRYVMVCLFLFQ